MRSTPVENLIRTRFDWLRQPVSIPLHISERRLLLGFVDLGMLYAALLALLGSQNLLIWSIPVLWMQADWFVLLSVIWLCVAGVFDLYSLPKAARPLNSVWAAGGASLITTVLYLMVPYLSPGLPERRLYVFLFVGMAAGGIALWRWAYARFLAHPHFEQTALVIGAGNAGETLARAVAESGSGDEESFYGTGYRILGYVDDDPGKEGQRVAGLQVLGTGPDLPRLVRDLRPSELILAITQTHEINPTLFQQLLDCREQGLLITPMPIVYERLTGRVATEHAGSNLQVVLPLEMSGSRRLYRLIARTLDLVVGVVGCVLLGLVIPWVWLANRIGSPGPLFFWQERVGEQGRIFRIVKFRSMVVDAEKASGAVWAQQNDPRITRVGHFLRRSRLDEIPQFWNVLKGEMSLIGPRPERPEFVAQLEKHIRFYRLRHAVKPGLTGWAQVRYRYGASVRDALIKLEYDLYYIKHQRLFLDVQILLQTVAVVFGLKGR